MKIEKKGLYKELLQAVSYDMQQDIFKNNMMFNKILQFHLLNGIEEEYNGRKKVDERVKWGMSKYYTV